MAKLQIDCQDYPDIADDVEAALSKRLAPLWEDLALEGDVTIKIGDEAESRHLNKLYRLKDSSTDVLSFILDDTLPDGSRYWGDIHIAYPVAVSQAAQADIPILSELTVLAVHGLLHLSGLDHEQDQGEMMARQKEIIEMLLPSA
jgi:probable rRNA maturation factor